MVCYFKCIKADTKIERLIYMRTLKTLIITIIALSYVGMISAETTERKARDIIVRALQKYDDLFEDEDGKQKGVKVNMTVNGENRIKMGTSNSVPVVIDMDVQMYLAQPGVICFDISGNLGSFKGLMDDENMLTLSLPSTKQFAITTIPSRYLRLLKLLRTKDYNNESIWKDVSLKYVGSKMLKQGKTHVIKIEPQRVMDWKAVMVYILDKKWDPIRLEAVNTSNGVLNAEVNELKFVSNMPDERLKLDINGYTQLTPQQILSAIMVQSMSETMQKIYEKR